MRIVYEVDSVKNRYPALSRSDHPSSKMSPRVEFVGRLGSGGFGTSAGLCTSRLIRCCFSPRRQQRRHLPKPDKASQVHSRFKPPHVIRGGSSWRIRRLSLMKRWQSDLFLTDHPVISTCGALRQVAASIGHRRGIKLPGVL